MPERATIEARDGTPIAEGEARLSKLDPLASEIAGRVGRRPRACGGARGPRGAGWGAGRPDRARARVRRRARRHPGGELLAGERVLATASPRPGRSVRTTIDPRIQRAAVEALAGRYGGIAAVRPRTGEVLALAGVAFSAPQPPGSVFKIITLAARARGRDGQARRGFPVQTAATLEGVELQNANGEACGGSLIDSFAHSCNSVFAPIGAELGAERLVAAAERFGFNKEPQLIAPRARRSRRGEIGDDLAVGSTAIGQGKVLTTPLQMALIAAAIEEGELMEPTLRKGSGPARARRPRARSPLRRARNA